jgi:peptidoglycan/LPS O-acetylase OafA/YrhL
MAIRNSSIDFLKLGLSFLIVALHIFPVSGIQGYKGLISYEIVNGITRIAVPTFFIISGYFLRNRLDDKAYLLKYGKRILLLYFVWQLIYVPDLIRFYRLGKFSTFDVVLKLIYGYWHLWYLLATVGGVFLLYYFRKITVSNKFITVAILFFIGYGYQLLYKKDILNDFQYLKTVYECIGTTRNFIFMGYPFLLLGTLYDYWKSTAVKINVLLVPSILFLLLESYLYYKLKIGALDFYLAMLPVSMLLFSMAAESKWQSKLKINATMSLGIFLCHPYMIRLVYEFLPQRTLELTLLKYVLISFLAILLWYLVERINRKLPYFL